MIAFARQAIEAGYRVDANGSTITNSTPFALRFLNGATEIAALNSGENVHLGQAARISELNAQSLGKSWYPVSNNKSLPAGGCAITYHAGTDSIEIN